MWNCFFGFVFLLCKSQLKLMKLIKLMKGNCWCFCCQFCKLCESFTCLHFALRHFPRQSGQVKQSGKSYFKICNSLVANIRDDSIYKYWNNFTVSRLYLMMTSTCKIQKEFTKKFRRRECCFGSNIPQSMFVNLLQLIYFSLANFWLLSSIWT